VLVGSSAGAAIAGSALDRVTEAISYVGIGYTFGWFSSLVFGSHYTAVLNSIKPKLFIMGTRDEFTSVAQLESKLLYVEKAEIQLVKGVNHFQLESQRYASVTAKYIFEFIELVERDKR